MILNRVPRITVIGRANMDIFPAITDHKIDAQGTGAKVTLMQGERSTSFLTEECPSAENDKVFAVGSLDQVLEILDCQHVWGGGGLNSAVALAEHASGGANLDVTFVTPSKPTLHLLGKEFDLKEYLEQRKGVEAYFMDKQRLLHNVIIPGREKNKIIFKNPFRPQSYYLGKLDLACLDTAVGLSDGILINSLGHIPTTSRVVRLVHQENRKYRELYGDGTGVLGLVHSGDYQNRPKYRSVYTVLTGNNDTRTLLNEVVPYTGIIANKQDFLRIFSKDENGSYDDVFECMRLLRRGYPDSRNIPSRIENSSNNIYVTDGGNGYLVNVGENVYHVKLNDSTGKKINAVLTQSKISTTGAGDAAAAGIIYQETLGRAHTQIEETCAVISNMVCHALGYRDYISSQQVEIARKVTLG
jgi:sugar/nucleoside kinase (ribokinase family)